MTTWRHHFLPQTYLAEWCDASGRVLRYIRVGPDRHLHSRRVPPRSIGFDKDLNTLPTGGRANGMTGDDLEHVLAATVDQRIPALRDRTRSVAGQVTDADLERDLLWLVSTFHARHPNQIRGVERQLADVQAEYADRLDYWMNRANTDKARSELATYRDPRYGALAAQAGVKEIIEGAVPLVGDLKGRVHVVWAEHHATALGNVGAEEFVTFGDAVVGWDANAKAAKVAFALSPERLLVIIEDDRFLSAADEAELVLTHAIAPISSRDLLIARSPVRGNLLAHLEALGDELLPVP